MKYFCTFAVRKQIIIVMLEFQGKYNKNCKVFCDEIETEAQSTIYNILNHPVFENVPIRIMSDCHQGKECDRL